MRLHALLQPRGLGLRFLKAVVVLAGSLRAGVPSSHLEKDERLILGYVYIFFMKASRVVLRGVRLSEES